MIRDRHVVMAKRRSRTGEPIPVHYFRPQRNFKRTIDGTDPLTPAYQRSLARLQDEYARWLASGQPLATGHRNAKGTLLDHNGMAITKPPRGTPPIEDQSVAWLFRQFMGSPQGRALAPSTRHRFDDYLQRVCRVPWPAKGPGVLFGDAAYAYVRKEHMLAVRSHFSHSPGAADYAMKAVRAAYYWAEEHGYSTTVNPAARMGSLRQSDGIPTMTYEEHEKLCAFYPVGTRERLAINIILFSGVRCCDLHMLGPQHKRGDWLRWTEEKGKDSVALKRRSKGNKVREWAVHSELAASISSTVHGLTRFIVHEDGQPFKSAARLSEAIRKWFKKAGVNKSAHSVRKLGATMLADNGADIIVIRDYLGHTSFIEAEIYIRTRDRRRASRRAIELMDIVRAAKAVG